MEKVAIMAELDGIEIPDELLDAVTGGAFIPSRRKDPIELMRFVKSHDVLKTKLIEFFTQSSLGDEATLSLVNELYDTL